MKKTFLKRFRRLFFSLLGIFIVLFFFRLAYGYTIKTNAVDVQSSYLDNLANNRKNYASKKYKTQTNTTNSIPIGVDQKYEKIASILTQSNTFEEEEKTVRAQIKANDALIQFEQKNGNKGRRNLHLVIGVPPDNFDVLYQQLIQIGNVSSKEITKKDKTNEYKELNAKKASLEKIRNSLIELKSKGGKIQEYVSLENRILEIEEQLQVLGVNLGDFDDENEFCTVKFSLLEKKVATISLLHRIKVALVWAIETYLAFMAMLFFMTLFAYFLLLAIDKLKVLQKILKDR